MKHTKILLFSWGLFLSCPIFAGSFPALQDPEIVLDSFKHDNDEDFLAIPAEEIILAAHRLVKHSRRQQVYEISGHLICTSASRDFPPYDLLSSVCTLRIGDKEANVGEAEDLISYLKENGVHFRGGPVNFADLEVHAALVKDDRKLEMRAEIRIQK